MTGQRPGASGRPGIRRRGPGDGEVENAAGGGVRRGAATGARALAQQIDAWYTQSMPNATAATSTPSRDLDRLDEALLVSRRLLQRPGYRRRTRAMLPVPIELTTLRVLRAVERAGDEPPGVGDVAEVLGVDPSSASRFVEQAVGLGYLERHACPRDRRRSRLALTAPGREVLDAATTTRRALLAEATDGWDEADVAVLADLLDRLVAGFDRFEAAP
ncbi:winged helix-turn-helix transcriptional regulator [Nitriliruptoraceae bacterium ZYF776]|nr:winged helix-turn-helix transcriptional regulator [Profundirhabdus halotolerans]